MAACLPIFILRGERLNEAVEVAIGGYSELFSQDFVFLSEELVDDQTVRFGMGASKSSLRGRQTQWMQLRLGFSTSLGTSRLFVENLRCMHDRRRTCRVCMRVASTTSS